MSRELVFVSPYGPPGTNGVCDHVTALVEALAQQGDFVFRRIGVSTGPAPLDSAHTAIVEKSDVAGLQRALEESVASGSHVFLHYVNYGFDRRGCPFGLIRILKALREQRKFRMITMFHELAASGPPWRSAFYTGPFQSYVWKQQAANSDTVATSTPVYRGRIGRYCAHVDTHPIFSNIGEPSDPGVLGERPNRAVVFGHPNSRKRVVRSPNLIATIQKLGVEEVIEVGAPNDCEIPQIGNVTWAKAGKLSSLEVSNLLLNSRFGLLYYTPSLLPKSGIFAAYTSHRIVPVLFPERQHRWEGLQSGKHYLDTEDFAAPTLDNAQQVADHSWTWYRDTWSVSKCAALYRRWIEEADNLPARTLRGSSSGFSAVKPLV